MADADVKEPTWMTQWRRYPVIWISSYIDIDISRYRYIQQNCCVILLVIEMCVDHWWRESQNQPNTNNWQVFHCIVFNASWESSQRSQKRKHHDHLMMSSFRILIRTKKPAEKSFIYPKWSFLILVLTFSIDKAGGRPWLGQQKPSPSFITQEVGRRCDSISIIQFSWLIVSHTDCNTVISYDITTRFDRFSSSLLYQITRIRSGEYFGLANAAELNETESWWHLIYCFPIDNLCFHGVLM